jgi:hypothetical protein
MTQIARKLNVSDIEFKVCENDFVPMWQSRLGGSSEEVSFAAAAQGIVTLVEKRKEGMLAGEITINKYKDPDAEWVATIGFQGQGVIVLDTKVYHDIGDKIRARDASLGYDPSDDEWYQGDVDILDRVWDAVVEIPEWERMLELIESQVYRLHDTSWR